MDYLKSDDALRLHGSMQLTAWTKGAVPYWIEKGYELADARRNAYFDGHAMKKIIVPNLVVNVGLQLIAELLTGDDTLGLTYHAIGTGTDPAGTTQTTLIDEEERKAFTSRYRNGYTASLSVFYTAAESTYYLQEAGIFGGASASATPDSGVMLARTLLAYNNGGGTVDLTYDYSLTINRA